MRRVIKKILGIVIFVVGMSIFLYPDYQAWKMEKELEAIMETVSESNVLDKSEDNIIDDNRYQVYEEIESTENAENLSDSKQEELFRILKEYNTNLITEGQVFTDTWDFKQSPVDISSWNDGSSVLGYIEIPEISLKLPIYIGATDHNMSNGAAVLAGTSMPIGGIGSNCVIAAHRGWSGSPYFRDIDKLSIGSEVIIHNLWENLVYQVTGTSIIHESEDEILRIPEDKDMVTLFSCYPYMSTGTDYRLVVFCERKLISEENEIMDEGVSVGELIDMELEEKGIIVEDAFTEGLSQKEDQIREILPLICILSALVIILCRKRCKHE